MKKNNGICLQSKIILMKILDTQQIKYFIFKVFKF